MTYQEIVIVSNNGSRYLLVNDQLSVPWKNETDEVAFTSPNFKLYPYNHEVDTRLFQAAWQDRVRLRVMYAYWPELENYEWRRVNQVSKVSNG
jgi:hypothetical protein